MGSAIKSLLAGLGLLVLLGFGGCAVLLSALSSQSGKSSSSPTAAETTVPVQLSQPQLSGPCDADARFPNIIFMSGMSDAYEKGWAAAAGAATGLTISKKGPCSSDWVQEMDESRNEPVGAGTRNPDYFKGWDAWVSEAQATAYGKQASLPASAAPAQVSQPQPETAAQLAAADSIEPASAPDVQYLNLPTRLLTTAEMDRMSAWELTVLRNSFYAAHGRKFKTARLQEYFESQSWYRPMYEPEDFPADLLTPQEKAVVNSINQYQKATGKR